MTLALLCVAGWSDAYAEDEIDVTTLPWVNNGQGCTQDFNKETGTVFGTDATGATSYVDVSDYGTITLYGEPSQRARLFINRGDIADPNGIFFVDLVDDGNGVGKAVFDCNEIFKQQPKAQHIHLNGVKASAWDTKLNLSKITVSGSPISFPELPPFDTSKNHMLRFTNGTDKRDPWGYQAQYTLPTALTSGKTYVFEAAINAVNGGETRLVPHIPNTNNSAQYLATKGLWTNEFTKYQVEFTASSNQTTLEIDLGACVGEVYFDNVSLVEKGESTNLIANGDFETEGTTGWKTVNNAMEQVENELGEVKEPGILVSVGDAGWRTFRTGSNVQISDAKVKAYVAKYVSEGKFVTLTEVTEVPTWQPVLIEAPQGNYMLSSPASVSSFPSDKNDLKANGNTALPGDGTLYGLAKKDGVVGFYKISASSEVPAYAIYLQIPAAAAEGREFIGFSGDATTVKAIETLKQSGAIYNLAGQQVKSAQKGIFIIDGKKVIK